MPAPHPQLPPEDSREEECTCHPPDVEALASPSTGFTRLPGQEGEWQLCGRASQTHLGQPMPHTHHEMEAPGTFSRAAGVRLLPLPSRICTHTLAEQTQGQPQLLGRRPPMDQPRGYWGGVQEELANPLPESQKNVPEVTRELNSNPNTASSLAVQLWTRHFTSLGLIFPARKMEILEVPTCHHVSDRAFGHQQGVCTCWEVKAVLPGIQQTRMLPLSRVYSYVFVSIQSLST